MLDNIWTEARSAWDSFRWGWMDNAPGLESERITIIGQPGAGKRTLLHTLLGWQQTGMPEGQLDPVHDYGLCTVIDLAPEGYSTEMILYGLEESAAIVYVIDGAVGVQPVDLQWIARLRARRAALLVVLNKADCIKNVIGLQAALEQQLSLPVLLLCARDTEAVQSTFVEALVKACPQVMVPLGAQVIRLRRTAAERLIRQTALLSLVFALEPVPLLDVTVLLGLQIHLVSRLGILYGSHISGQARWEIAMTVAFGLLVRYLAQTVSKFVPYGGWLVSGVLGASGTWAVGQAAVVYYESEAAHEPLGGQLVARVRKSLPRGFRR